MATAIKGKRNQTDDHEIKATNLTDEERGVLREHADGLSDSTLRAKWTHDTGKKADRPG